VKELWETEYKRRYPVKMLPPSGQKERDPDPAFDCQREHRRVRIDTPARFGKPDVDNDSGRKTVRGTTMG
jgi:hypothetical protein